MDSRPKNRFTVNGCFGFQHYKQSNQRPFIPRINSSLASAATREQGNSVRDKPFFCFFQKIEGGQNPGSTLAKGGGPFSIPWPSAGNIKVVLGSRCSMPGFKLGHGFHGFSILFICVHPRPIPGFPFVLFVSFVVQKTIRLAKRWNV